MIERYLTGYGRSCTSGSGDRNFAWLNSLIQTTWHDRSFGMPPWPPPNQTRHHDRLDESDAEESNQRPGRGAAFASPDLDSKQPRLLLRIGAAGPRWSRAVIGTHFSLPPK